MESSRARVVRARPDGLAAFVIGTVIGMVLVAGFCFGAIVSFGGSVGGALAVAAFCALFGGPGFGGTMGFVLHQSRLERERSEAEAPVERSSVSQQ